MFVAKKTNAPASVITRKPRLLCGLEFKATYNGITPERYDGLEFSIVRRCTWSGDYSTNGVRWIIDFADSGLVRSAVGSIMAFGSPEDACREALEIFAIRRDAARQSAREATRQNAANSGRRVIIINRGANSYV